MYQVFALVHCIEPPRVGDYVKEDSGGIGDWYLEKEYSCIILYGFDCTPHHLPKYVDDHIVLCKMYCQIVAIHTKVSQRYKKETFHSFPIRIGNFTITNIGQAKGHTREILDYRFEEVGAKQYDPKGVFAWSYRLHSYYVTYIKYVYHNLINYDWVGHK